MKKLNPELKQKWSNALRSGTYKQGRIYLKNYDQSCHCLLGVLYDIANPNGWELVNGRVWMHKTRLTDLTNNEKEIQIIECLVDDNDNGCSFEYLANSIDARL